MKRLTSYIVAGAAFLAWVPSAAAEMTDEGVQVAGPQKEETVMRYDMSPLVMATWADGVYGGFQLDGALLSLRGGFGYQPVLASIDEDRDGDADDFEALHTYQLSADGILFFWTPSPDSRVGFSGGYRYNSVLGDGYAIGIQAEAEVGKHATLLLSATTIVYPDGPGRAREALSSEGSVDFRTSVGWSSGIGVGVRFPVFGRAETSLQTSKASRSTTGPSFASL